jgi:hypothetical protein
MATEDPEPFIDLLREGRVTTSQALNPADYEVDDVVPGYLWSKVGAGKLDALIYQFPFRTCCSSQSRLFGMCRVLGELWCWRLATTFCYKSVASVAKHFGKHRNAHLTGTCSERAWERADSISNL